MSVSQVLANTDRVYITGGSDGGCTSILHNSLGPPGVGTDTLRLSAPLSPSSPLYTLILHTPSPNLMQIKVKLGCYS